MRAVLKGYYTSLIFFLTALLIFYFLGEISGRVLYLSGFFQALLFITPAIAGFVAGWHSPEKRGMTSGLLSGMALFFTAVIFLIWFLPLLLNLKAVFYALCYILIAPSLAAEFAYNLRRFKPAPPENK